MNSIPDVQTLILRHQPYGEQHPYIPLPYERYPRDPIAGDPVTLWVETGHQPSADEVWCIWRVEEKGTHNSQENRAEAKPRASDDVVDQWQVQLPAFQAYETVHYQLFACNAKHQVQSEEFTFQVLSWEEAISLIQCEQNEMGVMATWRTTQEGLFIKLKALPVFEGMLSLQLSAVKEAEFLPASTNQSITADWGDVSIRFESNPPKLEFYRQSDGLRLQSKAPIRALVDGSGTVLKYQLGFESPADEAFYGFGERFNALDQRGNYLDNYVYGQYTHQGKRTYIPVPFFISSRQYGLWLQTDRQAQFDMAATDQNTWVLTSEVEEDTSSLDIRFFFQSDFHAMIRAFTGLTGKPKLPPDWVFGIWMSSNDWNSQAEVLRQLHKTQELNIPASVLVIEAWSDEINFYIWNDAQYQLKDSSQAYQLPDYVFPPEGHWPDPKTMIDEIHQAGLRLVLWQNPTIKQAQPHEHLDETLNLVDQAYAIQKGYVVTRTDGSPHRAEAHMPWFQDSLVLDFTNPEAADWWLQKRLYLVKELGVDGFKTDGGEHIWDVNTRFSNGMTGRRGINYYPFIYQAAYRRFMESLRGDNFVLFSRAGYTGSQQNPCHWAGDEVSTWEAFRATVQALLNAGICGLPFVGWDIAGFAGPLPTSKLYLRAAAFSVFCPIMQYHSDVNHQQSPSRDRTPWNIQEQTGDLQVVPIFRTFANLRMNLLPYILAQAYESSQSGLPLMRAIALEYPEDRACRKYPYEYLFGDALLVAPIVEEGVSDWTVYLPEGEWRELWTGDLYQGLLEIKLEVPYDRIPVFQKKGSLLALNLDASGELGSSVGNSTTEIDHLTLRIFPSEKFETSLIRLPEKEPARILVETQKDGTISIYLPVLLKGASLVVFGNEPGSVIVGNQALPRLVAENFATSEAGWDWNAANREIRIHLPELQQKTSVIIR